MPSRDTDGIVAAFRRHFSVAEILIIESDLAKRPRCIKDRHFIEIYLKSEVNEHRMEYSRKSEASLLAYPVYTHTH